MSECRKETSKITTDVENLKNLAEDCLGEYLNEYSTYGVDDYGVDDIANGLLNVIAELEVIRCKLEYAEIKERWAPV